MFLLAVLQLVPDAEDPPAVVASLAGALVPGSCVAISRMIADFAPGPVAAAAEAYNAVAPVPVTARRHAGVTALFGGLSLVARGRAHIGWRSDIPDPLAQPADLYGGVARISARRR